MNGSVLLSSFLGHKGRFAPMAGTAFVSRSDNITPRFIGAVS
jgi:hypothetical protein